MNNHDIEENNPTQRVKIVDLILLRRSYRSFDPNRQLSSEQIIALCRAASWAPSCGGDEPWRFIVWNKFKDRQSWERAYDCLDEWNRRWVVNAPVLVVAIADSKFRNGDENRWSWLDTGAACENLYLQAVSIGLVAHPMAGFDAAKLRTEFQIPDQFNPAAMIAVGYRAAPELLEERYRKRETGPHTRRPIGDNFFDSSWANPIIVPDEEQDH